MTLNRLPNESLSDYKFRLLLDKAKGNISESWKEVAEAVDPSLSESAIRIGTKFLPEYEAYIKSKLDGQEDSKVLDVKYKETEEIKSDGSYQSDKLIEMSKEDSKDQKYLLEAHGFDPKVWELITAKNSIWNVSGGQDNPNKVLYSSKISVKPIFKDGINFESLVESTLKNIPPYVANKKVKEGKNLLELFLTDMHWGVNTTEDYKETLDEIIEIIKSKKWDTIYIPMGSDLLHNDDFKGRTTNDTVIEKVDMEKAWEEAFNFYYTLFTFAIENSVKVVSHYICGNHDKTMSFGLVKALSKVFTQAEWDTSVFNKKLFTWKDIAILCLHGDRGTQRINKTIFKEYGKLIANKKTVEIHTGDKHFTKVEDTSGVVFRILPTKAKTDEWHAENSFTGSMKCFHIFEYSEDKLKNIYHV